MGRGCFGLVGGILAIAVLTTTLGCGQSETAEVDNQNTELTSVKEEGECCGGCCSEEAETTSTECCGNCEKDKGTEVAKKDCCGKCDKDSSVLTSTESKATEACEYCKGDKACKECEKSAKEVQLETKAEIQKEN